MAYAHSGDRSSRSVRSHVGNGIDTLEGRRLYTATVVGCSVVYPTIQAAVTAAPAGGTVKVAAGTYDELVTVNKPLTLLGAQAGVDARSACRGKGETIVDGYALSSTSRSSAFDVIANDVTIDGFTMQGQTSSVLGAGVVLAPSIAGTHFLDNVVRNNVVGLYLSNASATDAAVIRHNVFASNNNPGQNNGRGIYTDGGVSGGLLTNVVINANTFTGNVGDGTSGNPEAAVGLEAATAGKQFNISITNNVMAGNGKGLLVFNATGVTFSGNLITGSTDSTSAAVRDEGNVANLAITNNTVIGGAGTAVLIDGKVSMTPSSNVTVNYNAFAGNAKGGVTVTPGAIASPSGLLDARFNYWGSCSGPSGAGTGSGQSVSAGVNFSNALIVPPPMTCSFASDNGAAVVASADATIACYALSLRNLSLLNLLLIC